MGWSWLVLLAAGGRSLLSSWKPATKPLSALFLLSRAAGPAARGGQGAAAGIGNQKSWERSSGYDRGLAGLTLPLVFRAGFNGGDRQDEVGGNRGAGRSAPDPVPSRSPRVSE